MGRRQNEEAAKGQRAKYRMMTISAYVLHFLYYATRNMQPIPRLTCFTLLMTLSFVQPSNVTVDHSLWDTLLHRYVDNDGRVAYRDWKARDLASFETYLKALAEAKVAGMSEAEEKAFWINTYNAIIIQGVLNGYTAEGLIARKRLFSWYSLMIAGKKRTPDEIEHQILRKKFRDPRIHFTIVCASTSCPKLRPEAYVPERLDQQLEDAARGFINDPQRNRFEAGNVAVSPIFQWFAQDFIDQAGTVSKFFLRYVADEKKAILESFTGDVQYLEYNWTLNAQDGQRIS